MLCPHTEQIRDMGDCVFCEVPKQSEICEYCNCVHDFIDFGHDLSGNPVLLCADRLHDSLNKND